MGTKKSSKVDDVTAEQKLTMREYRYMMIAENSPMGISLTSVNTSKDKELGQWILVNPAMSLILGYTEEELKKMTFVDSVYHDDASKNIEIAEKLLAGKESMIQWEKRYVHKLGKIIWTQENITLLKDKKGKPQYFLILTQDITETKEIEKKLKNSEERYHLVQKATGDVVWDWNIAKDTIYVSKNVESNYKYNQKYVNSQVSFIKWWKERIHPDDRNVVMSILQEVIDKHDSVLHLEYRFLRGDGRYCYVLGRGYVMYDGDEPVRIIGVNQNITRQKKFEAALRESEERYGLVVNNVSDLVTILDPGVNYIFTSPSHKTILGYESKDLQGLNAMALTHPDDLARVVHQYEKITKGDTGHTQFRIKHKDGHYVTLEASGKAIMNVYNKPFVLVVTAHDISEEIELHKKKNNFIKMASHELKTPLTSLHGMVQLLERQLPRDENVQKSFSKIHADIKRLITLVQSLTEESKLESGELDLHYETFRLDQLLEEIAADSENCDEKHTIVFGSKIPVVINGDRDRIGQVFTILLNNAMKFSPQSEKIILSISQAGDTAIASVQDSGIGIAKENQQKIFEPFFQVSNGELGSRMGMGFGLHIASEIVRRHRGSIEVNSKKGKGSIFTIHLPAKNIFTQTTLDPLNNYL